MNTSKLYITAPVGKAEAVLVAACVPASPTSRAQWFQSCMPAELDGDETDRQVIRAIKQALLAHGQHGCVIGERVTLLLEDFDGAVVTKMHVTSLSGLTGASLGIESDEEPSAE